MSTELQVVIHWLILSEKFYINIGQNLNNYAVIWPPCLTDFTPLDYYLQGAHEGLGVSGKNIRHKINSSWMVTLSYGTIVKTYRNQHAILK
jgi:hypothetical protein